jgi:hypothetical protein
MSSRTTITVAMTAERFPGTLELRWLSHQRNADNCRSVVAVDAV